MTLQHMPLEGRVGFRGLPLHLPVSLDPFESRARHRRRGRGRHRPRRSADGYRGRLGPDRHGRWGAGGPRRSGHLHRRRTRGGRAHLSECRRVTCRVRLSVVRAADANGHLRPLAPSRIDGPGVPAEEPFEVQGHAADREPPEPLPERFHAGPSRCIEGHGNVRKPLETLPHEARQDPAGPHLDEGARPGLVHGPHHLEEPHGARP